MLEKEDTEFRFLDESEIFYLSELDQQIIKENKQFEKAFNPQKANCENGGCVYLLKANPIWKNVYKIGASENPDARMKQLSLENRYGIFGFTKVFSEKIKHHESVEKIIHYILREFRITKEKGFLDTELFIIPDTFDIEKEIKKILSIVRFSMGVFSPLI